MKKATKITKIAIGFIIIFILIIRCSSFDWISFLWVRSLFESARLFLIKYPDAVFSILLILCFSYIAFDLYNLSCKKVENINCLENLEIIQTNINKEVSSKLSAINMSIIDTQSMSKEHSYQINMDIYRHDNRVKQAFKDMKAKYEKNLALYHNHTKHLYNIFLTTKTGCKISDVIKKYTNQL